jgi:hypothetical protein
MRHPSHYRATAVSVARLRAAQEFAAAQRELAAKRKIEHENRRTKGGS